MKDNNSKNNASGRVETVKIITCASYYGVGSSAVMDLVAEYNNVKDLTDFEFRFLHDIDGVTDLEYYLVENHNRHNSGHALKRFLKLSKFNEGNFISHRYSKFLKKEDYRKITLEYVNALTDFKYNGWWFYDLYDKGPKLYYAYQVLNHIMKRIPSDNFRILKKEITYCSHPTEEIFLELTRKYVSKLMHALNKEEMDYLEIDQIVPSSNIERILRYFDDEIFVFVVDRDPRDIYFLCKYYDKEDIFPHESVESFCKWLRYTRKAGSGVPKQTSHLIKIQFEDLIFRYEETVKKIEKITGLRPEQHLNQFSKLNPLKSVNNTQIWKKHTSKKDRYDLEYIEKTMSEYLYNFSKVKKEDVVGIPVSDNKTF